MGRLPTMQCSVRTLNHLSLVSGLLASGALSLAVATDFWLFTRELVDQKDIVMDPSAGGGGNGGGGGLVDETIVVGEPELDANEANDTQHISDILSPSDPDSQFLPIKSHAGLWRTCVYFDEEVEDEELSPKCTIIGYFGQDDGRPEKADTTMSICRAIRRSSPVIVTSLLIMIIALALSILGSNRRDVRTLMAAILYVCSALCLAVGVIFYISAVNDEVSHRKKSTGTTSEGSGFEYHYGWAFFFAGSSFISAMISAVNNITMYLRRFPSAADGGLGSSRYDGDRSRGDGHTGGQLIQASPTAPLSVGKPSEQHLLQLSTSKPSEQQLLQLSRPVSRINITTPV